MLHAKVTDIIQAVDGKLICGDIGKYGSHLITSVCTDSRQMTPASVFVPIIGEKVDAHRFIPSVLEGPGVLSLSTRSMEEIGYTGDRLIVQVDDPVAAIQKIGLLARSGISVPIVGVTGSVGKTTTRQMIAAALAAGGPVFATKGNQNSQIGVPITLCEFDDTAYIGVMELGMSEPGEMSRIARLVQPDLAVFTNIGIAHIQQLGSRENILREKMHITDAMQPGHTIILNYDDELLRQVQAPAGLKIYTYGLNPRADAYAEDIDMRNGCPQFTANIFGQKLRISLNLYGRHQISNALAAMSVAHYYGINLEKAAEALTDFKGFPHRQQFIDNGRFLIIDDSYNASPDSMRAGLDILRDIRCRGRRIAVLADMKELGEESRKAHEEIGEYLRKEKCADLVVTLGQDSALIAGDRHFTDRGEMTAFLKDTIREGDAVYLKGSNSMNLAEVADALTGC